ncbi:hypothetical protein [Arthrobacter sp. SO3]|uniref:hypothetical protein n=1 Tax=Arthrobacter sp. SO3 TaxID=1897057 RepID=UPI001CFF7B1A|nr:hypothetical protein [Arthrobacter sp. SO3]MCB5294087.1 hypothetical protein [Arthrobacter sp. SO3]
MTETLQEAIDRVGSPVGLLRNSPARPHVFPVTAEFGNWRSEQHSWRTSGALLDQSHHMTDLFLRGRGAERLPSGLAVNSFANFPVDRAKQFIAETGDHDVEVERDGNSIVRPGDPRLFRYELQGPTAVVLPKARYALYQVNRVVQDGETIGQSFDCGYIANEQSFVSLASLDPGAAGTGAEVTVLWGEQPNSARLQVEPHRQIAVRATVAPAPFVKYARESYRVA